ncbi:MAG: LIC_13387 family protein [Acidobacteriota bacterium]
MKASILLRSASVLTLVHAVLHTIGGVFGKTPPGPASVAVAAMRANEFVFMGATRTYWDFQRGLGLAVTIFLTMEALVFWVLARVVTREGRALRPVLAIFALGYIAFAVDSMMYFFTMAAVMELAIAILLVWAGAATRSAA